ncbi:MAG: rhomboid family intramembrane serine protease [Planctomycetota bacterium]
MFLPLGDNIQHRSFPIVSCLLLIINGVVFLGQTRMLVEAAGDEQVAIEYMDNYALNPVHLADGKVLGILTHMFLHGGFMHLLGNMVCLWAFACSLELCLGSAYFLAFYILWGVVAGLTETLCSWGVDCPLVGASGAIAGCIGGYTVMFGPLSRIKCLVFIGFHPITFFMPATAFGLLWIGGQLWDASNDPEGLAGIAWMAHIGGFFAGAATMLLFRNSTDQFAVQDKTGVVSFQKRETEEDNEPEEAAPEGLLECPYCGHELAEEDCISPGLAKCPSAACDRLVYSASVAAAATEGGAE